MNKIKAVLFDLDGTLTNTLDDLADAANYMLRHYGYPVHETEKYKYMVGNGMRKLMERCLPEDKRDKSDVDNALSVFMEYYNIHSLDKTAPYDGILPLLDELRARNIKTAVVTNKAETAAKAIIPALLGNRFDCIIGQRDGMPTKPDATGAKIAMNTLDVTPEECIFIGDSGVDMETAKNAKTVAIGALWGFRTKDELERCGADAVILHPAQLLEFV